MRSGRSSQRSFGFVSQMPYDFGYTHTVPLGFSRQFQPKGVPLRRASSRLLLHASGNGVRRVRPPVPYPTVPGTGIMSLMTSAFTAPSEWASMIACFQSSSMGLFWMPRIVCRC